MPIIAAIFLALLAAALAAAAAARWHAQRGSADSRFSSRGPLLSPQERDFSEKLELATNGRYRVASKISLDRIVEPGHGLSAAVRSELQQRLRASCLDFVLADEHSWDVLAVIRLEPDDGRSLARSEEREFVAKALLSANIHLLTFGRGDSYTAPYLAAQIESILAKDFIDTLTFLSTDRGSTSDSRA